MKLNLKRMLTALAVASPMLLASQAQAASYYPVGPQTNVPKADVQAGGWEVCFEGLYGGTASLSSVFDTACTKDELMFAGSPVNGNDYTVLAAAPREEVLLPNNAGHVVNGSIWYFSPSYAMGFAKEGTGITRGPCDTSGNAGEFRLCWHTVSGNITGGWRVGNTQYLNIGVFGGDSWNRTVLQRDIANVEWGTAPSFPLQPTSTVSPKRTVSVTVSNETDETLEIGSADLTGVNADDFDVVGSTCPTSLAVGASASCTVQIRFIPQAQGVHNATLGFAKLNANKRIAITAEGGPLPQGPQGDQGPQGPIGTDGPQGPQGSQGDQGPQGDPGTNGVDGTPGTNGTDGTNGATGPKGDAGTNGTNGSNGAVGPAGDTGPAGPKGDTGATGPKGDTGAKGKDGKDAAVKKSSVTCKTTSYQGGSRVVCVFDKAVSSKTLIRVKDSKGALAAARGRGSKRMIFISARPAKGKLTITRS